MFLLKDRIKQKTNVRRNSDVNICILYLYSLLIFFQQPNSYISLKCSSSEFNMTNNFKLNERIDPGSQPKPYRSVFEIDKSRIIHSEAFRRMQTKTQVLQTSESDFHRNRLTHSIEVAQIGKGISRFIENKYQSNLKKYNIEINHDLIESICLIHDSGHPPFGHGGEIALNYMMRDHGGFEGNGQTLRIVSKLGKYSTGNGMNLTRRTLLGVLKYPCPFSKVWNSKISRTNKEGIDKFYKLNQNEWKPPKCYFDVEQDVLNWILSTFDKEDSEKFITYDTNTSKNHYPKYKSFDCSIMDLADDISYAIHDFEDGFELGIFKDETVSTLVTNIFNNEKFKSYISKYSLQLQNEISPFENLKRFVSICVDFFVVNAELMPNVSEFKCPYLNYKVKLNDESEMVLELFKTIVRENIIESPHSEQLVKNGQIIVCHLFDVFDRNHQLLPRDTQHKVSRSPTKERIICDYISGMTDRYALKMYEKLFGSEIISFFEK